MTQKILDFFQGFFLTIFRFFAYVNLEYTQGGAKPLCTALWIS